MVKALVVIDYENEWINPVSEYYVGDISKQIVKLNKLINFCRSKKMPIIFITHVEPDSKKEFVAETKSVEIIDSVDFQKEDVLIKKNKISAFYKTDLEMTLKKLNVTNVLVTGILTNLCVRSFVSDAYDRGFDITVVTDTCVALSKMMHEFTIKDFKETRPEIKFLTVTKYINL